MKNNAVKLPLSIFGRTYSKDGMIFFNWSGSGFSFEFTGTRASAEIFAGDALPCPEERPYIGVFTDGSAVCTARFALDSPRRIYTLTEGLPYGRHTVKIVKQTEMYYGSAALCGIETDGEILPILRRKKRIEFIGDSITCGYGNISSNANPDFTTAEENFSLTYAALACERLGAEPFCVAASGNGIYHDYGLGTVNLIPELYRYTDFVHLKDGENCEWDFYADGADAVVIKLGQNDANYCLAVDLPEAQRTDELISGRRSEFRNRAESFLNDVRNRRPGVPIVYIIEKDMLLKEEILAAAEKTGGITPLIIAPKRQYEGVGANGHWSTATHARVSLLLSDMLLKLGF